MAANEEAILEKLQQARDAYSQRQYQKAVELYRWVADQIQDDKANLPIIYIELGWSYYKGNDFKNSILFLKKALSASVLNSQQRFDCLKLIGFSYQSLKDVPNTLLYLDKAIAQEMPEPKKRFAYFEIGKIHFTSGALKKSKPYLQKAEKYFSWQETIYFQAIEYYLGFIAFYDKQFDFARKHFSGIIENAGDKKGKAAGYFGLAHLSYEKRNYRNLLDFSKKIVELDKDFYDKETVLFFMCKSFMELKQDQNFISYYNSLQKKYPSGRYHTHYPVFEKRLSKIKNKL